MINLRKQRQKFSRNSLMLNASTDQALIQIKLNSGCFKGHNVDELNSRDALAIYNFLCSLLAYALRTLTLTDGSRLANIIVLIDSDRVPIKVLRLILRASQNALAYKIKHAVLIEPDRFFDQQRISLDILLEAYDFKTTMCSRSKIWKYVDTTSMYQWREGIYHSEGWVDIKKKFEDHFCSNPSYFASDTSTSSSCIACLAKFLKKDQSVLIELTNETKKTVDVKVRLQEERLQINSDDDEEEEKQVPLKTPDEELKELDRDEVPSHIVKVLEERSLKIQEIIEWVEGPCEEYFTRINQICKSIDEVQRAENQLEQMMDEFRAIKDKANELFSTVNYLRNDSMHGNAYDSVSQNSLKMNTLLIEIERRAEQSIKKLGHLKKFHSIASELNEEVDLLIRSLCSESKNLELTTLKSELKKLDYKIKLIEKNFEVSVETVTMFCALVKEETPNAEEQPAEIAYLSEQLSLLNERRRRCLGLVDIQKLKIQQLIQLFTCEQDAQQVIDWIKELQQNAQIGDPITKITKFEDVAKKMEQYGNQLCEVSLLLRRSLRLEVNPQLQLQQTLQITYNLFNESIKRLKMAQSSFYK